MDWKSVIEELSGLGYSQPEIARACQCGQATISDLATGKTGEPRYSLGQALQALLISARVSAAKREKAGA